MGCLTIQHHYHTSETVIFEQELVFPILFLRETDVKGDRLRFYSTVQ
ncbi:hypothetical protein [Lentibacillus salicampi]|nr:hypothetical protein [Lentibacillus salicampi]